MKTTKTQFRYFCRRFRHWNELMGPRQFRLVFEHNDGECPDALATCWSDWENGVCQVTFNDEWEGNLGASDRKIDEVAFHEARELFYSRLFHLAMERYVTIEQIHEARHAMIRRDERLIFPVFRNKLPK